MGGTLPPLGATFPHLWEATAFTTGHTLAVLPNIGDDDVLLCSQVQKVSYKVNFIRHLHISHYTPCLLPKTLRHPCLRSLLGITVVPRKIKQTMLMQNWGLGGGGETSCIMGDVQMDNS